MVVALFTCHTLLVPAGPAPRHGAASLSGRVESITGGGSSSDVRYIDLMTAAEYAASNSELSKLSKIYHDTEMRFKLEQSRHITVLMPTDKAIERAARQGIDVEFAPYDVVLPILQTLVIPEVVKLQQLDPGSHVYTAMDGTKLTFEKPKNPNKAATVNGATIGNEVDNANGVAYVLNALIYPDSMDVAAVRARKDSSPHTERDIPDHVEMTNQAHSRYDQVPTGERMETDEAPSQVAQHGVIGEQGYTDNRYQSDTTQPSPGASGEPDSIGVIPGAGLLPPEEPTGRGSMRKSHVVENRSDSAVPGVRRRNRNN